MRRSSQSLQYCPFLPVVTSLLLVYLEGHDALKVLRLMLEDSTRMLSEEGQLNRAEEMRGLRWYFPLDRKDFYSVIETFMTFMADRSNSIKSSLKHMEDIGVDPTAFIKEQFSSFFLDYVPLDIVNTLFPAYLNEGIKILFRIGYAFFKTLKDVIAKAKCAEDFEVCCAEALDCLSVEGRKKFVNTCYYLRIVRIKTQFSLIDTHECSNHGSYICEPSIIDGESHILPSPEMINQLYTFVPSIHKANDLKLIFATWRDGRSLQHMIKLAEAAHENIVGYLIIIEAGDKSIFGTYLQHRLGKTSDTHVGSAEDFLFRLRPEAKCFKGVKGKHVFYQFDGKDMYIGACKGGCGLVLDSELQEGQTSKSTAFDCPPLTGNGERAFNISKLELFTFT